MIHTYGHDGTIHDSEHVDVEVDSGGKVVAVWFRCVSLSFRQSVADDYRADAMRFDKHDRIKIKAIQYDDGTPEKPIPPPGRILREGEQPDPMKDKGVWLYRAHMYMCVRFTVPRYTIALMAVLGTCLGLAICGTIWPS